MPGYVQVQWFDRVPSALRLSEILNHFKVFLYEIGFTHPSLETWLSRFSWDDLQEFGFAETFGQELLMFEEPKLHVTPNICGFNRQVDESISSNWIELNILFSSHEVAMSSTDWRYKTRAGQHIWQLLYKFAVTFNTNGAFLTDEASNGKPWYALTGDGTELWNFDLALVPHGENSAFLSVPGSHVTYDLGEWTGIARRDVWTSLPWE